DPDMSDAEGLELDRQVVGHGAELARGAPAGDDHVVGDAGFSGEVDGDHGFGLVVVERLFDEAEELFRRGRNLWFAGLGGGCDGRPPLVVALRILDRRCRISVAEIGFSRPCTNNHAGGFAVANLRPAPSLSLYRAKRRAALAASAIKE